MSRTMRDIPIPGRNEGEVLNDVMAWMNSHGGFVVGGPMNDSRGTNVKIRMGVGYWQSSRFFEISIRPDSNGVVVHTVGYTKAWGQEEDLSPNAISGALPRREGWRAIEDLWNRLASPSAALPASPPSAGRSRAAGGQGPSRAKQGDQAKAAVPPGVSVMLRCRGCGTLVPETAKFCGKCGESMM